ncbi:MAG: carboxypeptidase-like regulatory domain-containing protein [Vulcanimicrobiaceae bacterium]
MNGRRVIGLLSTIAFAVVFGSIADRTTGQPLTGVHVTATGANHRTIRAVSNAAGHYVLRGVAPGAYSVTVSSDDVPPQRFSVNVGKAPKQRFDMTACSTTLDYGCGGPAPSGGGA